MKTGIMSIAALATVLFAGNVLAETIDAVTCSKNQKMVRWTAHLSGGLVGQPSWEDVVQEKIDETANSMNANELAANAGQKVLHSAILEVLRAREFLPGGVGAWFEKPEIAPDVKCMPVIK